MSEKQQTYGQLLEPKAMILRNFVGNAKDPETGQEFEMSYSMTGCPIVRAEPNGNWFSLSWQDIIQMSIDRGILEPFQERDESKV